MSIGEFLKPAIDISPHQNTIVDYTGLTTAFYAKSRPGYKGATYPEVSLFFAEKSTDQMPVDFVGMIGPHQVNGYIQKTEKLKGITFVDAHGVQRGFAWLPSSPTSEALTLQMNDGQRRFDVEICCELSADLVSAITEIPDWLDRMQREAKFVW